MPAQARTHISSDVLAASPPHFLLLVLMERRSRLRNVVLSRDPDPEPGLLPGGAFREAGECGGDLPQFSTPPELWSLCAVDGRPLLETNRLFRL
jgi:hypothetical protein